MTAALTDDPRFLLDRSWWSFAGPHGGYIASRLLAAASRLTPHPPRALHVQFPAAAVEGPADVDAALLRQGRSAAFANASLRSGQVIAAHATVVLGGNRPGPAVEGPQPPHVDPPEGLAEFAPPVELAPFSQHLEYRPPAGEMVLGAGRAEVVGWVRFRDDRPLDDVAATVLVDALPPALYGTLPVPVPVPTADLHVQYAGGGPAHGWALLRIVTRSAADGWCVDDSDVWTRDGRLLASARQTRLVLGGAA